MPKILAKCQRNYPQRLGRQTGSNRLFSTIISLYLNKKLSYRRGTALCY